MLLLFFIPERKFMKKSLVILYLALSFTSSLFSSEYLSCTFCDDTVDTLQELKKLDIFKDRSVIPFLRDVRLFLVMNTNYKSYKNNYKITHPKNFPNYNVWLENQDNK